MWGSWAIMTQRSEVIQDEELALVTCGHMLAWKQGSCSPRQSGVVIQNTFTWQEQSTRYPSSG